MSEPLVAAAHLDLFGGLLFSRAFIQLASALRWMFWGWVLQLIASVLMISGLAVIALRLPWPVLMASLSLGLILWFVASFVVLRGQYKCLHLEEPLGFPIPGRRWIQLAYGCEMASILLRLLRRWVGRGVLGFVILPLELLSVASLLLFLRKIADILARPDLRRWIDVVLGSIATSVVSALALLALIEMKEQFGRPAAALIGVTILAVGGFALLGSIVGYGIVLWRMGTAARSFGDDLLVSFAWREAETESVGASADV